jgi:hypothetical protein
MVISIQTFRYRHHLSADADQGWVVIGLASLAGRYPCGPGGGVMKGFSGRLSGETVSGRIAFTLSPKFYFYGTIDVPAGQAGQLVRMGWARLDIDGGPSMHVRVFRALLVSGQPSPTVTFRSSGPPARG